MDGALLVQVEEQDVFYRYRAGCVLPAWPGVAGLGPGGGAPCVFRPRWRGLGLLPTPAPGERPVGRSGR